jgi:zinc protease
VGFKEELSRMLKDGFTDEEIKSAKSGLLQGKKVSRAQDRELVRALRRNLISDRTMQWNKAYEQRLAALTADDVKRVMNKYLKIENFSIIKAGDMSKVEG